MNVITVGSSTLIFTTSFTARDLEQVVISDVPSLSGYQIIITFDPKLREGETPGVAWVGEPGIARITVHAAPKTWMPASIKASIARIDDPQGAKELSFVLAYFSITDFYHVTFELYVGPAQS